MYFQSTGIHETKSKALRLEAAALTVRGQQRKVNEDAVFHHIEQKDDGANLGLFVLCDGMGGHDAGEVASQMAIQAITAELDSLHLPDDLPDWTALRRWVQTAVTRANHKIWQFTQTNLTQPDTIEGHQPGTTITLILIYGSLAVIANVGDSRAYAWRAGQLKQITRDHSLVTTLVKEGLLPAEDAATHPYRNILNRALGISEAVTVDLFEVKVQPGDKFLLCSDGVWHAFPDTTELNDSLNSAIAPDDLCRQLIAEAGHRQGSDDMSVLAIYAA